MSLLQDVLSIFKKRELTLIESHKESEDVYTFSFEKEKDLNWKAGQHGLFKITHKKIKSPIRPFSLASAPTEDIVRITMRISNEPSDFKKAMLELTQGMKISMSGPVGSFYLKENTPTLLVAGGIGITPFRSIIKQIEAEGNGVGKDINLLYIDSKKTHIYKDELDRIASNTSLSVTYLDSKDDLHQELDKFASLHNNNGRYFIAGPKAMVASVSSFLQNKNIQKRHIKRDAFYGY